MPTIVLEKRVVKEIEANESTLIAAWEEYLERFDTPDSTTLNGAARKRGLNPTLANSYIFYCPVKIGMPETREDSQEYLGNLREYKESRGL